MPLDSVYQRTLLYNFQTTINKNMEFRIFFFFLPEEDHGFVFILFLFRADHLK